MQVTASSLSKQLGIEYVVAASILKLAVATGQGKEVGKVKTSVSGKGKPSTVYEVPETLTISLKTSAPVVDETPAEPPAVAETPAEPVSLPEVPQAAAA